MIVLDEEFSQIKQILSRLRLDANSKLALLVDRNGQQIAAQGDIENVDITSFASLTAGNVAATDGLAKLLGEDDFSGIFHEGKKESVHISPVGDRIILVICFDDRSSLGLVRLRVKKATVELIKVFEEIMRKSDREKETLETAGFESPFAEITDEDIDSLFSEQSEATASMTFINYASREINCKIVYYGPGLCGKTTNLQHIYDKTNPGAKGKLISLATETDRTLFFDFLPLELGNVRGFRTRFHLYTVPGQVFYDASRRLILKGVDGVIFVADSQEARMDANIESIENLKDNLKAQGYNLMNIPYVLQLNKRDLPNVVPVETMAKELQLKAEPVFPACAVTGEGVFETLKAVAKQVLMELRKG